MKIICDAPGQTCNRLWSYVATLSECIVKNKRMILLFFDYTIEDYPYFKHSKYIYFPLYCKHYLEHGNGWNNFKGLTWKACHNKRMERVFQMLGWTYGWHTRKDTRYIQKAKTILKSIFKPNDDIVKKCEELIIPYKKSDSIIVGVHIRRGDYKTWNNGDFYFDDAQYYIFMKQVETLFSDKKVCFFISSNEKINTEKYKGLNLLFLQQATATEDLYALSICDYIIGPPSTFSRWASFIGEKPLCFLLSENQKIQMDSFSKIVDFYHFENGSKIYDW